MKISIFVLFCITFIFYILGELAFPLGSFVLPYYFIVGVGILLFLCIYKFKQIIYQTKKLLQTIHGKFLLFFVIWAIITILVSTMQGTFVFGSFISNFIGNFFCSFLFPMLLMLFLVNQIKNENKIKKFILIIYFIILVLGIIEWFAIKLDFDAIKQILSIFTQRTSQLLGNNLFDKNFATAFEKPRIGTIFREPGEYAGFLIVSCPIFFYLSNLKEHIFKIPLLEFIMKKSLIYLWLINLILTQSPINLVFAILIGLFYICTKFNAIIKFLFKYKYITISFVSFILLISITLFFTAETEKDINIEKTYLSRITTSVKNMTSINNLVQEEPSLATRVCTHEAQIRMGLHYPIFGVGYANTDSVWWEYVLILPHQITEEVYIYALNKKQAGGSAYLWKIFSETGFIGLFLLYAFWFSLCQIGIQTSQKYNNKFIGALSYSLLIYICYSWYLCLAPVFLVYYGILMGMINKYKTIQYKLKHNTTNQNEV